LKTEKKIDSSAMTTRVGQAPKKVFKGVGKPNGKTHKGTNRQDIKKGLHDYNYYLGSARKASDYEMTTEYIINYIKKTFDYGSDIAQSLKELQDVDTSLWKPTLQQSDDSDDPIKTATVNKQHEVEFQADYDAYQKKLLAYENNKTKAYALLWERCTKAMKNKIESRTNFESKVENNPIELLKAIKEHALNYQEHRYDMSIILDAHITLLGTKQKEDESLQDYTKRFRVAKDVFESHMGGPMIIIKVVEAMQGYNETDSKNQEKYRMKLIKDLLHSFI
jgi:hypothetical protein